MSRIAPRDDRPLHPQDIYGDYVFEIRSAYDDQAQRWTTPDGLPGFRATLSFGTGQLDTYHG